MPAQILRPYQQEAFNNILEAYRNKKRAVIAVAPTAAGKTTVFGSLMAQVPSALLLVHRRELAEQACNRLREFGVDFGLIMAGEQPKPWAKVQVATVQTLVRRRLPQASLVVCDEAHLSTAETWQSILSQYPHAKILGVTATPWRLGGKPLVGAYDACVVVATPRQLREQGYLSPYVGFSYKAPDLSGIKSTGGDYNEKESAAVMSSGVIVDSVVEEYGKHALGLSAVVFNVTIEHSKQVTARFRAAGISAEHLDGNTGKEERKAILKRIADGKTHVLCNVGVAVEGLDIPRLKCCVLNRPTKSLARAVQMMGRVFRPWNDVTARIHDHASVINHMDGTPHHGLPDDDRDYTLRAQAALTVSDLPPLTRCSECLCTYRGPTCPECKQANPTVPRDVKTIADAEKVEFSSADATPSAQVERKPVDVRWSEIGRVIEGIFSKRWDEPTEFGKQRRYLIKGKRDYVLPGTVALNAKMSSVKAGDQIRVTYTGETSIGNGKHKKEFRVEVDSEKRPPDCACDFCKVMFPRGLGAWSEQEWNEHARLHDNQGERKKSLIWRGAA